MPETRPLVRLSALLFAGAAAGAFLPTGARPAAAQIGEAVAIRPASGAADSDEVLVLRTREDRGRPAVVVYRLQDDGAWRPAAQLGPASPAAPYEGFSPSLARSGDVVAAGAADAGGRWAASVYRRGPEGWSAEARLALDAAAEASADPAGSAPGAVDMALLTGMMQPPARRVALGPAGRSLAAWSDRSPDRVVLYGRDGAGEWSRVAELAPPDAAGFPGEVALAVGEDMVVVGAANRGIRGEVLVYDRAGGEWRLAGRIAGDAETPSRLGDGLLLDGDRLLVRVQGDERVLTYTRQGDDWAPGPPILPDGDHGAGGSTGFGHTMAVDGDDLWIGAPLAEDRGGVVHRYRRTPAGEWRHAGVIRGRGLDHDAPEPFFGAAIALGGGRAVVGAPGAAGGSGRVAVFTDSGGAGQGQWTGPAWIEAREPLRAVVDGRVRCRQGEAAGFDCRDVDLLAFLPVAGEEGLGGDPRERVSDIWGWADPETGREYALVGRTAGMLVVDVTAPSSPRPVALVPANPSGARDIKTYADHAFMTGDGAGAHGLVIFDLTRLRDLPVRQAGPDTLEADARYTGIASAHNLIMDAESGIAIPVGANGGGRTCGGGLHILDVSTPLEPVFLGCYTDTIGLIAPGRSHDGQCVVYGGPDERYRDRRVCLVSNETALRIVDITDPAAVEEVARADYPGAAYTHQGWLTEDHRYFFMNDELDELVGFTDRTRTLIWDVAELDDPVLVGQYLGPDGATDHNLFIRGNRMYQANYQAGLHVVDISDPDNPVGIGSFDTTPYPGNPPGFSTGAWTAYPFLPSGTVLVSSMYEGLFLLKPRPILP